MTGPTYVRRAGPLSFVCLEGCSPELGPPPRGHREVFGAGQLGDEELVRPGGVLPEGPALSSRGHRLPFLPASLLFRQALRGRLPLLRRHQQSHPGTSCPRATGPQCRACWRVPTGTGQVALLQGCPTHLEETRTRDLRLHPLAVPRTGGPPPELFHAVRPSFSHTSSLPKGDGIMERSRAHAARRLLKVWISAAQRSASCSCTLKDSECVFAKMSPRLPVISVRGVFLFPFFLLTWLFLTFKKHSH